MNQTAEGFIPFKWGLLLKRIPKRNEVQCIYSEFNYEIYFIFTSYIITYILAVTDMSL